MITADKDCGDIERYGTGFMRIRESLQDYPELAMSIEEIGDFLKVELRVTEQTTPHDSPHDTPHVGNLLRLCEKPIGRAALQEHLGVKDRKYFYKKYLTPALDAGLIELTIPDRPKSKLQQYRLTDAGISFVIPKNNKS